MPENNSYLTAKNLNMLKSLPNHMDGEVAYCEDEASFYIYKGEEWSPVRARMGEGGLELNLYDLNKQIIAQMEPLEEITINAILEKIDDWVGNNSFDYVLLYGREISYFTLFVYNSTEKKKISENIKECLSDLGTTITIEYRDATNSYEIWVKDKDNSVTVLYLFDYTKGVIYFG